MLPQHRRRVCSLNIKPSPNYEEDPAAVSEDFFLRACVQNTQPSNHRTLAGTFCPSTESFGHQLWHMDLQKSHNYLDYITGPPTPACTPKYSNRHVSITETLSLWHCISELSLKGVQVFDAGLIIKKNMTDNFTMAI